MSYTSASGVADPVLQQQLLRSNPDQLRHHTALNRPQAQQLVNNGKAADLLRSAAVAGLRSRSTGNYYRLVGMSRTQGVDSSPTRTGVVDDPQQDVCMAGFPDAAPACKMLARKG